MPPDQCLQLRSHGYKEADKASKYILLRARIHEESNSIYKELEYRESNSIYRRKRMTPYISFANDGGFFASKTQL